MTENLEKDISKIYVDCIRGNLNEIFYKDNFVYYTLSLIPEKSHIFSFIPEGLGLPSSHNIVTIGLDKCYVSILGNEVKSYIENGNRI